MTRRSLSKKLRFEVFKRDSFTCQYCGAKAPDVVLNVDHIEPVSKQGTNDILNLITACRACNAGKSDRRLADNSVLEKQRSQLEDLQERREQIEMMFEWQSELANLDDQVLDRLADFWAELVSPFSLNEHGRIELKKLQRKFDPTEIMTAMRIAVNQYLQYENDQLTHQSAELAWKKVGGICSTRQRSKDKPYLPDIYYVRGILRNRLSYVNQQKALELLEASVQLGADLESLKEHATKVRNWTEWRSDLEDFIAQNRSDS